MSVFSFTPERLQVLGETPALLCESADAPGGGDVCDLAVGVRLI
jgi:hypothetical protein